MADWLSTPVVICGLSPTGLYAARELKSAGFHQIFGITDEVACGESSRCFKETWRRPIEELEGTLGEVAERFEGRAVLLATSDRFIEALAAQRQELRDRYVMQASYEPERVRPFLDKGEFRRLCDAHGVEAPGVFEPSGSGEFLDLCERARFPCILKPRRIHQVREFMAGRKVVLLPDQRALRDLVGELPFLEDGWLVQEMIPGPESDIWLMAASLGAEGRLLEGFVARKLRQYPPGFGSASLARSQYDPDVEELSLRLLRAVGFRGVCGTEFKRDPRDGKLKMIEINPRPTLWFHLAHASGRLVMLSCVADLLGQDWRSPRESQIEGVTWRYLLKDLTAGRQWRSSNLRELLPPPDLGAGAVDGAATCWPVWSPDDPAPAFRELQNYALKGVRRLWRAR